MNQEIKLTDIHSNDDFNCRGKIQPSDVMDLVRSIETTGLLQPIVVMEYSPEKQKETGCKYLLLAGYNRYMAFRILKRDTIPTIIHEKVSEAEARFVNLTENVHRRDLNILQEARAISKLKACKITEDMCAKRLNKSRGWVQIRYMLLSLPKDIQDQVAAGFITQAHIRELYTIYKHAGVVKCTEAVKILKERKNSKHGKVAVDLLSKKQNVKRHRKRQEIFELQDHIREHFGNSITTQLLGWCAGELTNIELYEAIKEYADDEGYTYSIPKDILQTITEPV